MSADRSPPPNDASPQEQGKFFRWLIVGAAGVALLFVVSAHFPEAVKIPGLFAVALGAIAGWGLGRWGAAMGLTPGAAVAIAAGVAIAGGEGLAAAKTQRDRARYLRAQPKWQESPRDPVTDHLREYLAQNPGGAPAKDREVLEQMRADFETGEARRRERLEFLTFYGYLTHRIPKDWGRWSYPWPAIFWGAEVLLGSVLGAWLTLQALSESAPQSVNEAPGSNAEESRGDPHSMS